MSKESTRQEFIGALLDRMTVEEKVGQCLVIGFQGNIVTPEARRHVREYHPGGIRVTSGQMRVKNAVHDPYAGGSFGHRINRLPHGTMKDFVPGIPPAYCTNEEYAAALNELKSIARETGAGVPLHATMDFEGDMSCDHPRGGLHLLPSPMGVARSGDPRTARDVAWAAARQLRTLGVFWLHSPVLCVNTEPMNPEISTRSYGEDPDTVTRFALEALKGFREAGVVATGKHFPGRGAGVSDAHHGLPVIDLPRAALAAHLAPFRACIAAGLPCIMTAHTIYPALDDSGEPATLSKRILTDLLKNEWGFRGTVTSDAMEMGGILQGGPIEHAILKAINAGCDLVLMRDEGGSLDEIVPYLVKAARSGDLPAARLDDAVRRTLGVKYDHGFFEHGCVVDAAAASAGIRDPRVAEIANRSARQAIHVLRSQPGLLPLKPETRVLLVEQVNPIHVAINTTQLHPALLWEKMLAYSPNVGMVETTMEFNEDDRRRVLARLDQADVLVVTHWYFRRIAHAGNAFIRQLAESGKPVIVISNNPYPLTAPPEFRNVIVTYGVSQYSLQAAADTLYGR